MFVVGTFNADLDKSSSKNLRSPRSRMAMKSGANRRGGMAGRDGDSDGAGADGEDEDEAGEKEKGNDPLGSDFSDV